MADEVRVLIVDDSAFVRRAVERMLLGLPSVRVVGTASNGVDAVRAVEELGPHVVIMDVNMPKLNGLEALKQIMTEHPTGVLMLSTLTREGAEETLHALELGAVDFIDKNAAGTTMDIYALAPVLREKVLAVAGAAIPVDAPESELQVKLPGRVVTGPTGIEVVVIGASTGGPRALAEIVAKLPHDFPAGIVIAQHMPPGFTETLAERLDRRSELEVREAADGDLILPGTALVAPGGLQISVVREGGELRVRLDEGPSNLLHRPSVDLLFRSAADVVEGRAVGIVLTGMGDDGARGLKCLRDAGAVTLAESEETAVIYGMPRAAAAVADHILPLQAIPRAMVEIAMGTTAAEARD